MPRTGSVRSKGRGLTQHLACHQPTARKRSGMVTTMNPDIDDIVRRVVARVKDELVTPEWLTPDQAAVYCGLTARGLEDLRYRKAGPVASKVGGRIVRYRRADLDAWLVAGREA